MVCRPLFAHKFSGCEGDMVMFSYRYYVFISRHIIKIVSYWYMYEFFNKHQHGYDDILECLLLSPYFLNFIVLTVSTRPHLTSLFLYIFFIAIIARKLFGFPRLGLFLTYHREDISRKVYKFWKGKFHTYWYAQGMQIGCELRNSNFHSGSTLISIWHQSLGPPVVLVLCWWGIISLKFFAFLECVGI